MVHPPPIIDIVGLFWLLRRGRRGPHWAHTRKYLALMNKSQAVGRATEGCSALQSLLLQRQPSGAYEEGIAGMITIIKASLLGSALMLLESCTGYLTNYQTPCVEGHVCECVQYTTWNRSWLDCRDYGRVKSLTR